MINWLLPNKRVKQTILTVWTGMVCFSSHSQNLVLNPGFELYFNCPVGNGQVNECQNWSEAGSADYFNSCSSFYQSDVPGNNFGFQYAHSGNAYVGFAAYAPQTGGGGREVLFGNLQSPLTSNKNYCIKFYVSPSDSCRFLIDRVGLVVTDTILNPLTAPWPFLLPIIPSIEWTGGIMSDTSAWYEVKGIYSAFGGEQFISITNFSFNEDTDTLPLFPPIPLNTYWDLEYFYLDDVSVYELPEVFAGNDTIIYAPNSTLPLGPLTTKPGITYSWSPATGLSNPNIPNPTASPAQTTTYVLTVNDTSQYACYPQMYDTVTVTVIDTSFNESEGIIFVPSAFSPNNDNNNDILYVRSRYPVDQLEFKVFDRWGVEVFSTTDQSKGWDGKYKEKALNNAVFMYYAKGIIRGKEYSVKGNVTLIR